MMIEDNMERIQVWWHYYKLEEPFIIWTSYVWITDSKFCLLQSKAVFFLNPVATSLCPAQNSSDEGDVISLLAARHTPAILETLVVATSLQHYLFKNIDTPHYKFHAMGTQFYIGFFLTF